jgi:hypothetical protein
LPPLQLLALIGSLQVASSKVNEYADQALTRVEAVSKNLQPTLA